MLKAIQPISKRDQVVAALKKAILSGAIAPGAAMVEGDLARRLGSGIPLVREALIVLEQQGFVRRTPFKGTRVTELRPKEVKHILDLRMELESLAAGWAQRRITPKDSDYLQIKAGRMEGAARGLDLVQFYENDLAFHRKLRALSDNPYLADTLERLVLPLYSLLGDPDQARTRVPPEERNGARAGRRGLAAGKPDRVAGAGELLRRFSDGERCRMTSCRGRLATAHHACRFTSSMMTFCSAELCSCSPPLFSPNHLLETQPHFTPRRFPAATSPR